MQIMAAFEAKTHFSKLLVQVEQGEEVMITKHGHAVAKIIPIKDRHEMSKQEAIDRLSAFKEGNYLQGLDWKALRDEGRR